MSSHKRDFQCFNTVGSHKSSQSCKHHGGHLPRISQHGLLSRYDPLEECYFCSEYVRHAQALEALETQASPLCYSNTPCVHHQYHQYVSSRPDGPPQLHHRYNKKVVLVKNSDPSMRRTIVLHRRNLRSFGLFLEELSALMQYHIRKLYTLEGSKVRTHRIAQHFFSLSFVEIRKNQKSLGNLGRHFNLYLCFNRRILLIPH